MKNLEVMYPERWFQRRTLSKRGPHVSSIHLADAVHARFAFKSVIDLGGGTLSFANRLGELGHRAVAVDASEFNKQFATHCRYIAHDLSRPFPATTPPRKFDLVTSWDVIEHIDPKAESVVIRTVVSLTRSLALLSIDPSTWGHHHLNCHGKGYWIDRFSRAGLLYQEAVTKDFAQQIASNAQITSKWYGRNLMVFYAASSKKPRTAARADD